MNQSKGRKVGGIQGIANTRSEPNPAQPTTAIVVIDQEVKSEAMTAGGGQIGQIAQRNGGLVPHIPIGGAGDDSELDSGHETWRDSVEFVSLRTFRRLGQAQCGIPVG